jgi:hypothetical protein
MPELVLIIEQTMVVALHGISYFTTSHYLASIIREHNYVPNNDTITTKCPWFCRASREDHGLEPFIVVTSMASTTYVRRGQALLGVRDKIVVRSKAICAGVDGF